MRALRSGLLGFGLLAATACGDSTDTGHIQGSLQASDSEDEAAEPGGGRGNGRSEADEADQGVRRVADAGPAPLSLMCPRGGDSAPVSVVFACDRISVVTCKDLSNVVVELADGSRHRVEGLNGKHNVFASTGGGAIAGVWVKAGANHSGDGPGYGQRFDAPASTCPDGGTGTPPAPPTPPTQDPPLDPPPQNPPADPPPSDPTDPIWLD